MLTEDAIITSTPWRTETVRAVSKSMIELYKGFLKVGRSDA